MSRVRSADGTPIAYDITGEGPLAILVGGAFSYRAWPQPRQLAELLQDSFTVINDVAIEKLALYEPVFAIDDATPLPPANFVEELTDLIPANRPGEATKYFFTKVMGIPSIMVAGIRLMPRLRKRLDGAANTLPYEAAILEDNLRGKPLRREQWAAVTMPTLVVSGEKSEQLLQKAAAAIVEVLPNARHRTLEGQAHNVSMKALAPVLREFFAETDERAREVIGRR